MQRIIHFVIITVFTFSAVSAAGSPFTSQNTVKTQITHSHSHDHAHHHHDAPDSEIPHTEQTDTPDHQHSHELVICCAQTIFLDTKPDLTIAFEFVNSYPDQENILPPRNCSLASIFRPPIFA